MNEPKATILPELRARFQALYGPRLERLVLFGSHARGDAEPDSDIDVLVVLDEEKSIREYREQADDIICELSLKFDTVVSCVFTTPEEFDHSGMPFFRNVRREAVPL